MFVEQSVCCESTKRFCLSYAVCIVSMIRNNSQNREIEYIGKPVRELLLTRIGERFLKCQLSDNSEVLHKTILKYCTRNATLK